MRTFVWTAWEDSSSAWCTAFPGQPPIWTCWKSRQEKLADRCLELGRQSGLLHKKYKVYLDHVGVAHVPDITKKDSPKSFPTCSNICTSSPLIPTTLHCQ